MNDLDALRDAQQRLFNQHPVIRETAILPTRPLQDAVARVHQSARRARSSIAFWADPITGKSSCLRAIELTVQSEVPGAGVLVLEGVEDTGHAEGRLLVHILTSINYGYKIKRDLAEKRDQVKRALLSLSGPPRHLFILIDEAQELSNAELGWLKAVINAQCKLGVKVTTVLFGQRELQKRRDELLTEGRSDLGVRFMKTLREFHGVRSLKDVEVICQAMDAKSEYPAGSGWTYTQFLFPRAFSANFRLRKATEMIWDVLKTAAGPAERKRGFPMAVVAAMLAEIALKGSPLDTPNFVLERELVEDAVAKALKD